MIYRLLCSVSLVLQLLFLLILFCPSMSISYQLTASQCYDTLNVVFICLTNRVGSSSISYFTYNLRDTVLIFLRYKFNARR